jgi:hypothetical protein
MPPREETDVQSLDASLLVKAAAATEALSGLFTGLGAVQLMISGDFVGDYRWAQYVVWTLGVLGLASLVLAAQVMRMRMPRTIVATCVALLLAPAVSAWFAFCVSHSIFSLMQLVSVVASWLAALLLPFALPATKRAGEMRKRLADAGLDLGF